MADKEKATYPRLPIGAWWALRKKFVQSIPGVVTTGYLATVLNMKEDSARSNILPFLKTLGIIDEEGKVLELGKRWRDDSQYAAVCKEIREKVYPAELRHAVTDPAQRPDAERWFLNKTDMGVVAAKMMAAIYEVLLEADVTKQPGNKPEKPTKAERGAPARPRRPERIVPAIPADVHTTPPSGGNRNDSLPGININLEIHISADSSPEQIEKIFESMAKHIYQRKA